MSEEGNTDKSTANSKDQVVIDFKKRFKYGLQVAGGLKETAEKDSSTDESSK
jgi:hypothetical protein